MGIENEQNTQNTQGAQDSQNTQAAPTVAAFAQTLTAEQVASVSSAGVSISLRSGKEISEGVASSKALSYNPLKYWNAVDRNARK